MNQKNQISSPDCKTNGHTFVDGECSHCLVLAPYEGPGPERTDIHPIPAHQPWRDPKEYRTDHLGLRIAFAVLLIVSVLLTAGFVILISGGFNTIGQAEGTVK